MLKHVSDLIREEPGFPNAMPDDDHSAISVQDAKRLFADWKAAPAIVLAVSGGPDSIALMWLAARWRRGLARGPRLFAVTVDHGLRAESAAEARDVKRLARSLELPHRTVRWTGAKPKTGLPAAARAARYRLLAQAARANGATHIFTAHTRDDQAETLLMRMMRGSGIAGLAAMARQSEREGVLLARPFLHVAKSQLVATLEKAKVGFADDPTNRDLNFTRPRIRAVMPVLAAEGGDSPQSGAARVAAGPGQRGGGSSGRRRRALSGAEGSRSAFRIQGQGFRRQDRLPGCRKRSGFGCCCARSSGSVMRGRQNSARLKRCCRQLDGKRCGKCGSAPATAEADPCRRAGQPDRRPDPYRAGAAAPPARQIERIRHRCRSPTSPAP